MNGLGTWGNRSEEALHIVVMCATRLSVTLASLSLWCHSQWSSLCLTPGVARLQAKAPYGPSVPGCLPGLPARPFAIL